MELASGPQAGEVRVREAAEALRARWRLSREASGAEVEEVAEPWTARERARGRTPPRPRAARAARRGEAVASEVSEPVKRPTSPEDAMDASAERSGSECDELVGCARDVADGVALEDWTVARHDVGTMKTVVLVKARAKRGEVSDSEVAACVVKPMIARMACDACACWSSE